MLVRWDFPVRPDVDVHPLVPGRELGEQLKHAGRRKKLVFQLGEEQQRAANRRGC